MDNPNPSTLDKLAALAGKAEIYIPVAGQYIKIADVALHALAKFLDTSGSDLAELTRVHAEYQRRIQLAQDPTS